MELPAQTEKAQPEEQLHTIGFLPNGLGYEEIRPTRPLYVQLVSLESGSLQIFREGHTGTRIPSPLSFSTGPEVLPSTTVER